MINRFDGKYYFLSNFYGSTVNFEGLWYLNNEAAFQSAKVLSKDERKQFCNLPPNEAKRLGRRVRLRPDWENVKDDIMEQIVRNKFISNETLCKKFIQTGNKELIEGNTWNDKYWGVCNGVGLNKLGKILMKIREEVKLLVKED